MLDTLLTAFTDLMSVQHLSFMMLGILVGLVIGVLPALGGINLVAQGHQHLEVRQIAARPYRTAEIALFVSAVLVLGVGLTDWGASATLGALVILLLAPVGVGMSVWVKRVIVEQH